MAVEVRASAEEVLLIDAEAVHGRSAERATTTTTSCYRLKPLSRIHDIAGV